MMRRSALSPILLLAALALVVGACAPRSATHPGGNFDARQIAKTDIDRVAEAHRTDLEMSLRALADKLYKRNPHEWQKGGWSRPEEPIQRLFGAHHNWRFPELKGAVGPEAIQLAFREDYADDRVFAFIAGLGGMLLAAFNDRYEYYVTDDLDPQKMYNVARNVEVAAWKLAQSRDAKGQPLLLSNEIMPVQNLSFEREFGKIIGSLDTLSRIIADKTNRTVVKVVQSMATAVFLPVAGLKGL